MVAGSCRYIMKALTMLCQSETQHKPEIKAVKEQQIC
jgi:hypothetical protein